MNKRYVAYGKNPYKKSSGCRLLSRPKKVDSKVIKNAIVKEQATQRCPHCSIRESFKKQSVREYAFSKKQIQVKYGIKGKSLLLDWCRKYGKFAYNRK